MAQFSVEIADKDVNRVLVALAANSVNTTVTIND